MSATHRRADDTPPATGSFSALVARVGPGEPHVARGPFARWPRASDACLAGLVFLGELVAVGLSDLDEGESLTAESIGDRPAGVFVLLALSAAALWWRRSRPITVTVFVLAIGGLWALADYGDGHDLALVVAVYSVGRYSVDHRHSLAMVLAAGVVSVIASVVDANQRIDVLPAVVVAVLPWYVGRRIRNRGDYLQLLEERAERLRAEQQARARQAVVAERSRIARELHDVVAHQVSMMTVQAGAAKTIARHDLDAAVVAMGDVERAGRQALGELRHLLGVLRRDAADPEHLGPQPGLVAVPGLADELTSTGADVILDVDDRLADLADGLSTALDLSAYRIVQEACTNIVKHGGTNPTVHITVALDGDSIVIDITNTITSTTSTTTTSTTAGTAGTRTATAAGTTAGSVTSGLPASGFGLAGMRERAALLGGTIAAGPEPPNRYRVHARLPLEPEPS